MGEPKSDSIADNVAQVSISDIDEEVTRQAPPHKKIYVIFFGLFLILIFGFTEKIYQMRIASEHLELTHNKKLLTISKEHENVRARLQKEIDELSQENIFLKRAKPKPIIKSKIDSTDLSNNNCQCVSKLNSNDFSIFEEDAADEGYNLNFKSCWGDLGQAPPHKKIYVIFFGLFLILIFGFTVKIYQMSIALELLEQEHENVRARLQKRN